MSFEDVRKRDFPNLPNGQFRITSPVDRNYNCVAWAADSTDKRWWEPSPHKIGGYYWPNNAKKGRLLDDYCEMFKELGFTECNSGDREDGFEKIAIYGDSFGNFKHVARMLNDGFWTSKLGQIEDITHLNTNCLAGNAYGSVQKFMKKKK